MNEDEKVLTCGYGFMRTTEDNKLKLLSLLRTGFYDQTWDENLVEANVFIFWTYEIGVLSNFIKSGISGSSNTPSGILDFLESYEPCPLKLIKNVKTGKLRLEITCDLNDGV